MSETIEQSIRRTCNSQLNFKQAIINHSLETRIYKYTNIKIVLNTS